MDALTPYIDQIASLNTKLDASLKNLSLDAVAALKEQGLPHRRVEDWKYTNLNKTFAKNLNTNSSTEIEITDYVNSQSEVFSHYYILNGELNTALSDKTLFEVSEITASSEYVIGQLTKTNNYFKKQNDFLYNANIAALSSGYVFTLAPKAVIEKPVMIHHLYNGESSIQNFNLFFEIGKNADAKVIETYESKNHVFVNCSTRTEVQENAIFAHTVFQNVMHDSFFGMNVSATTHKNATYKNVNLNLGANVSRTNLYVELVGEHAEAHAHGLYALNESQHHDTMSYIYHKAPLTDSHQLYKGILDGASRGVFTGRVYVERDAQQINAAQLNKNLLLTKKAQANSRPQLEIFADDVKCAHGSTTGQLSDSELFYFESRGITKEKARQMLASAFANEVVLKIDNLATRKFVQDQLQNLHIIGN